MSKPKEKTIDIIKKLLAHADSARDLGNLEEAEAFAGKANRLLLEHKLTMSEVEMQAEDVDDPFEVTNVDMADGSISHLKRGNRLSWLEDLAVAVANAHFCRLLVVRGTRRFRLVGRESDREIAEYLLRTLADAAIRQARRHTDKVCREAREAGLPAPKMPKASYLRGFVDAVSQRLYDMRREVEEEGGQFALVRFDEVNKALTQYMEQRFPHLSKAAGLGRSAYDYDSYRAGQDGGSRASLHGGLSGGKGTMSSGRNLLGGGS